MQILQIEDDDVTARSCELMLKVSGFTYERASLGREGIDLGMAFDYDLILLDLMLPDISGLTVLTRLRAAGVKTPVIVLSGCDDIPTKAKVLNAGADDYITKPFHRDELTVRIQAVVRRARGLANSVITIGVLSVNMTAKVVKVAGTEVYLTGREYDVVEFLALRRDQVVSREALMCHMYGGRDEPELKILDVFTCKLRKKLAAHTNQQVIETVWGRGYKLVSPTEHTQEVAAQ
jgi:two-component system, cell cycle response regulator CtrA